MAGLPYAEQPCVDTLSKITQQVPPLEKAVLLAFDSLCRMTFTEGPLHSSTIRLRSTYLTDFTYRSPATG
jgi:hypothetical protein